MATEKYKEWLQSLNSDEKRMYALMKKYFKKVEDIREDLKKNGQYKEGLDANIEHYLPVAEEYIKEAEQLAKELNS